MLNEPRTLPAIALWLLCIVLGSVGYAIKDDSRVSWLAWVMMLSALMFGVFAFVQTVDVIAFRTGQRMREINMARVLHITQVANAVQGLTSGRQLEIVEAMGFATMSLVPGDIEPILFVDVPGGRVPHETVTDFFRQSVETAPYLMPVRRGGQPWRDAVLITALLVAHGWAEKASGPHAARLTVPIEKVAAALWVELDLPELK